MEPPGAAADVEVLSVDFGPGRDTPATVLARVPTNRQSPPTVRAAQVLRALAGTTGLTEVVSDLRVAATRQSASGLHVRYQQTYAGLRVVPGEVRVHLHEDGATALVGNDSRPGVRCAVTPSIDMKAALASCRRALEQEAGPCRWGEVYSAELVICATDAPPRLAYEFMLAAVQPDKAWYALVDAHTGALLGSGPFRFHASGLGRVFSPNPIVATQNTGLEDQDDSDLAVPSEAYSIVDLRDLDGSGYLSGSYVTIHGLEGYLALNPSNEFYYWRSAEQFEQVMVYHHMTDAQRYIQSLGYHDACNRPLDAYVNITLSGLPFTEDNAYYAPDGNGTGYVQFGTGGVDLAEDGEVVLHEYWHAIQDNLIPNFAGFIVPDSLPGHSIAEGSADMWAICLASRMSGGFQDECFAEWEASGDTHPCLRRVDAVLHYPENYSTTDLQGRPSLTPRYQNSLILSGAWFRLLEQLGPDLMATHMLEAQSFLARVPADFREGAWSFFNAGTWLYRWDYETPLRIAFESRGLMEPLPPGSGFDYAAVPGTPWVVAGNDAGGLVDTMTVDTNAAIGDIRFYVRLEREAYDLDQLRVELVSPSGTILRVWNDAGRADPLSTLRGESMAGDWTLRVVDVRAGEGAGYDTTVHWWGLELEPAPTGVGDPYRLYR